MDRTKRLNDEKRRLWVLNNEPLYWAYRSSKRGMRLFIRENRTEIDRVIRGELDRKPL
jgi:hypothetical protein